MDRPSADAAAAAAAADEAGGADGSSGARDASGAFYERSALATTRCLHYTRRGWLRSVILLPRPTLALSSAGYGLRAAQPLPLPASLHAFAGLILACCMPLACLLVAASGGRLINRTYPAPQPWCLLGCILSCPWLQVARSWLAAVALRLAFSAHPRAPQRWTLDAGLLLQPELLERLRRIVVQHVAANGSACERMAQLRDAVREALKGVEQQRRERRQREQHLAARVQDCERRLGVGIRPRFGMPLFAVVRAECEAELQQSPCRAQGQCEAAALAT